MYSCRGAASFCFVSSRYRITGILPSKMPSRLITLAYCGRLETVPEAEREAALQCLMAHYGRPDFAFDRASVAHTRVFRLAVESMTGKRRKIK